MNSPRELCHRLQAAVVKNHCCWQRPVGILRACLEVLAGECSYSYTLDRRLVLSSSWEGRPRDDPVHSFGRDAHGSVTEEGDTRLASQISRINPGDQWGDRCRSQIALLSPVGIVEGSDCRALQPSWGVFLGYSLAWIWQPELWNHWG